MNYSSNLISSLTVFVCVSVSFFLVVVVVVVVAVVHILTWSLWGFEALST